MMVLNAAMLLLPSILTWIIHVALKRGDMSRKKKAFFLIFYIIFINVCTFSVSYLRGVKGFDFGNMTLSYRIKYLGLGCLLGCIILGFILLKMKQKAIIEKTKKCVRKLFERLNIYIRYIKRFFVDTKQYFPYAIRAARADLRAEVTNSFLDWLWWLIEPFCMMLIYAFIFGIVMKSSEQYFPIFIFSGLAMFTFFSRGINGSVDLVRANKAIITKVYLPKYVLLVSRMLVNGFKMMVSFCVVSVMMLFFKVPVTVNIIWFLPILLVLFVFTFGLGTILMHYGVYVSDLSYIIGILMNMLMYMSGIFYSMDRVPAPLGELLKIFNPLAFLISSMRNAILYGQAPSWRLLGIWAVVSLLLSVAGIFIIYHNENSYVKVI